MSIDELNENVHLVLKDVLSQDRLDYSLMRTVSFCNFTINQIERSQDEIENLDFRYKCNVIDIHPFECYVTPTSDWDEALINDVLYLVRKLYKSDLYDRAADVFKRWFTGTNIAELIKIIDANNTNISLYRNVAEMLGEYTVLFDEVDILEMDHDVCEKYTWGHPHNKLKTVKIVCLLLLSYIILIMFLQVLLHLRNLFLLDSKVILFHFQ